MSRLLVLLLLLAGAFGLFLARGVPQTRRVERSAAALRAREAALRSLGSPADAAALAEYSELSARHERAQAQAEQRWALLTEGGPEVPPAPLATLLDETQIAGLRRPSPLADELARQAAASPVAEATLQSIVRALPPAEGLTVEELELRDEGRPRALPDDLGLEEVEAQLVITGALADVLAALERLAPARGAGLPILTVRSASLRRIEPERWGGVVRDLPSPPVRLSCTLAVLFAPGRHG